MELQTDVPDVFGQFRRETGVEGVWRRRREEVWLWRGL